MSEKKKSNVKYDDGVCDLTMDGCGSNCNKETCPAMAAGACRGCSSCDFGKTCPKGGCDACCVRCWRKHGQETLEMWIDDVGGLEFNTAKCIKPFCGELPFFIPQVRKTNWLVDHDACMLNIQRFVNKNNMRWFYKKKNFRDSYRLKPSAKTILTFSTEDDLIESIWTRQFTDWGDGKNFWQGLSDFGFSAAISVNYSCFSNHPRMEHALSLKRNILTAQRMAKVGIPVIMDLMWHSEIDFDRLVDWGIDNGMKWYNINCQTMKKASWALDVVFKSADRLFSKDPNARLLISGIIEPGRIKAIVERYGNKIALSNFGAFMHTSYHRYYDIEKKKWIRVEKPLPELWKQNIDMYEAMCKR